MENLHNTHLISNSSISNHSFGNDWEERATRFDETTFNALLRGINPHRITNETFHKKRRFKLNSDIKQNKPLIMIKKFSFTRKDSVDSSKNQTHSKHYGISELTEVEILNGKMRVIELKREGRNIFCINPSLTYEYKGNKTTLEDTYRREVEFAYQGKTTFKITHMNGGVNNNEFYFNDNPKINESHMKKDNDGLLLNNISNNNGSKLLKLSKSDNDGVIKEAKEMFDNPSQNISNLIPSFQSVMLPCKNNNHFTILCKNKSSSFVNNNNMSQGPLCRSDDRFNSDKIKLKKIKHVKNNPNFFVTKGDNFIIECNNQNSFDCFSVIQKKNENENPSENSSISLTPPNEKIIKECKSIQVSLEGENIDKDQGKYKKKDALGNSIHPSEESSFSSNNNEKEQDDDDESEKEENAEEENNEIEENKESSSSSSYRKPQINNTPYYLRNLNNKERRESEISSKFKNIRLDNIDKVKNFKEHQLKNKQFLNNSNNSSFNDSVNNNNNNDKHGKERRKSNFKTTSQSKQNKTDSQHKCNHGKSFQKHSGQPDMCPVCIERSKKKAENLNSKYINNNSNNLPFKGNTSNGSSFYETYEKNVDYYRTMMGGNTKTKEATPIHSSRTIKFKSKLSGGDKISKSKMESIMKQQQSLNKSPSTVTFQFGNGKSKGEMLSNNKVKKRRGSQSNNINDVQFPSIKSK